MIVVIIFVFFFGGQIFHWSKLWQKPSEASDTFRKVVKRGHRKNFNDDAAKAFRSSRGRISYLLTAFGHFGLATRKFKWVNGFDLFIFFLFLLLVFTNKSLETKFNFEYLPLMELSEFVPYYVLASVFTFTLSYWAYYSIDNILVCGLFNIICFIFTVASLVYLAMICFTMSSSPGQTLFVCMIFVIVLTVFSHVNLPKILFK